MATQCIVEGSQEWENVRGLRKLRQGLNLTTSSFGARVGVSAGTISRIERFPASCTVRTYNALGAALGWELCKTSRYVDNVEALQKSSYAERSPDSVPQELPAQFTNEQFSLPGTITQGEFKEFMRLAGKLMQALGGWLCVE